MKLKPDFYLREDVVQISRELLGKVLCTDIGGQTTMAVITDTEAYAGETDKASHAYGGRRTQRTEPMYGEGGAAYIYLCYGIHHLFNVVTNEADVPHAVLIRAARPGDGLDVMLQRRGKKMQDDSLLGGPGSLAKALGITTEFTGTRLSNGSIWIEDHDTIVPTSEITVAPRVGVDYAAEDAARPYRFIWTVS